MEEFDIDYIERPRMRVTEKAVGLISVANDKIRTITEDIVTSAVLLNRVKPIVTVGDNRKSKNEIPQKTKDAMLILEDSLYTMESLAALDDNAEGLLLLLYPNHVKESLEKAIHFLEVGISDMKECIARYEKIIEESNPESSEGYLEGYISMTLQHKIEEFEETIIAAKKALDIFIL